MGVVAYLLYTQDCPNIPRTTHNFNKERIIIMKIHFAYYNQYKNGINIAFADNTLLFLSCVEAEIFTLRQILKGLSTILRLMSHSNMLHWLLMVSCRHGLMLWMRIGIRNKSYSLYYYPFTTIFVNHTNYPSH